jgi:hypothetical protein
VPWLLSGDAAMAFQGVSADPDVIEFRAISPVAVAYFAQFMRPFEAPITKATVIYGRGSNAAPSESWRSNPHQRIASWVGNGRACWLGRWSVEGTIVQVLYAQGVRSDPISLAVGAPVRRVPFEGMQVPVVPLEFLLADSALRSDNRLTGRILHALRVYGHNASDLQAALDVLPSNKASRLQRLLEFSLVAG